MANTAQDEIYRSFLEASQQQSSQLAQTEESLADLILQADQVRREVAQQSAGASSAVRASRSKQSATSSQGSGSESVFSEVFNTFKSGLGLSPLLKGIFSLFGGGGDDTKPTPLVKYALPSSIDFQAAEVGGRIVSADYGQNNEARAYRTAPTQATPAATGALTGATSAPQITVNVSAMDARSFMDRSGDIAAAVRDAMLNLNSINDVVSDL